MAAAHGARSRLEGKKNKVRAKEKVLTATQYLSKEKTQKTLILILKETMVSVILKIKSNNLKTKTESTSNPHNPEKQKCDAISSLSQSDSNFFEGEQHLLIMFVSFRSVIFYSGLVESLLHSLLSAVQCEQGVTGK